MVTLHWRNSIRNCSSSIQIIQHTNQIHYFYCKIRDHFQYMNKRKNSSSCLLFTSNIQRSNKRIYAFIQSIKWRVFVKNRWEKVFLYIHWIPWYPISWAWCLNVVIIQNILFSASNRLIISSLMNASSHTYQIKIAIIQISF